MRTIKDKSLVIVSLLLALLIIIIISNAIFIVNVTGGMKDMLSSLPNVPGDTEKIADLRKYWDSHRSLIALSTPTPEIDRISNLLDSLYAAAITKNSYEYKRSMAQLSRAIDGIGNAETVSARGILRISPRVCI